MNVLEKLGDVSYLHFYSECFNIVSKMNKMSRKQSSKNALEVSNDYTHHPKTLLGFP